MKKIHVLLDMLNAEEIVIKPSSGSAVINGELVDWWGGGLYIGAEYFDIPHFDCSGDVAIHIASHYGVSEKELIKYFPFFEI